jgi:hypothetical protein
MTDSKFVLKPAKVRTRAERLEEEQRKKEELMQKQRELAIEKARILKRYMLAHASQQERSKTEASISLGNYKNEEVLKKVEDEQKKEELKKDAENILTILDKIKIQPSKKKIIKHYMLNKLEDTYK